MQDQSIPWPKQSSGSSSSGPAPPSSITEKLLVDFGPAYEDDEAALKAVLEATGAVGGKGSGGKGGGVEDSRDATPFGSLREGGGGKGVHKSPPIKAMPPVPAWKAAAPWHNDALGRPTPYSGPRPDWLIWI